jgi:hypothetical protein
MRVFRKGVDDAHALFDECVGLVDNAERRLAACDIGKGGARIFLFGVLV